ncbi:MAG TPA: FkbM family methyltransferase [Bryobacteraceae bacterium]|nr:FkbM family methyltransferase [Bryobacteraceae bacterium]
MSVSERQESIVTGMYSLARRSGFLETAVGQWLFQHAYFRYKRHVEDPYNALLRRLPELLHGGNVLDIGANIGYTPLLFSRGIDPRFKVYAFEPDEFNFRLLERAAASRKAQDRIRALRFAVGDTDGSAELWINPRHHGDHRILTRSFGESRAGGATVRVPLVTVDTFVRNQQAPFPVRFIKVDVQGYELAVCRGMERTLAENPRMILAMEYMPRAMRELGFEPRELLQWIGEKGYCVYILANGGMLQVEAADQVTTDGYVDLLLTREQLVP